jgi:hypothetical protein
MATERWEWFGADLCQMGDDPDGRDARFILSLGSQWPGAAEARIIAAAPELLTTCRGLLAAIRAAKDTGCLDYLDAWEGSATGWHEPIARAEAAIARAEGR